MSFRDERLELVNYDTIMGQAMRKPRTVEHEELAAQMREWERTHAVTVYASGASSGNTPTIKDKKDNGGPKRNASSNASGYLNITIDPTGAFVANVSRTHLGSFKTIEEAVAARDRHRKVNGMLPAKDFICNSKF